LLPLRLADHARIVLTTSGTHDPGQPARCRQHATPSAAAGASGAGPDRCRQPRAASGRAYTASKLCMVLTARALAAQPEARARQFTVVAYDPGRTPGTGMLHNHRRVLHALWQVLGSPLLRPLVPSANSRSAAGGALTELALGRAHPPAGRIYSALHRNQLTWPDPSELARRDDLMHPLWRDSATLVGMDYETTHQLATGTNHSPKTRSCSSNAHTMSAAQRHAQNDEPQATPTPDER
jgi:NAD(P)-dependent dehydrogenase (short-subunit alcohol dehydrogenase family)